MFQIPFFSYQLLFISLQFQNCRLSLCIGTENHSPSHACTIILAGGKLPNSFMYKLQNGWGVVLYRSHPVCTCPPSSLPLSQCHGCCSGDPLRSATLELACHIHTFIHTYFLCLTFRAFCKAELCKVENETSVGVGGRIWDMKEKEVPFPSPSGTAQLA